MMKRIDVIKSVRARDAFEAEREQREKVVERPDPDPPAPRAPAPAVARHRPRRRSGYFGLVMRTALSLLFILGLVYAVNEAMTYLLK